MEGNLRFKIDWASLVVGRKFTVFAVFYFTIQYNSLLTLPWWGFSVTMRLLIKIREVVNNSIKKERVR